MSADEQDQVDASGPRRPAGAPHIPADGPQEPASRESAPAAEADGTDVDGDTGADAVRTALNRARAAARERGVLRSAAGSTGRTQSRTAAAMRRAGAATRSGAHPDARDPQTFGAVLEGLVADRGWQVPLSVGGVMGRWDAIVGAEIAAHCRPETFVDGVLSVRADSTAWATQVRLLVPTLMRRLAEEVGEGTVTTIVVRGPGAPSWRRGPLHAPGQGPRDTYG